MSTAHHDPVTDVERLVEISQFDLYTDVARAKLHDFARRGAERIGLPIGSVSIVLDAAQYLAGMHGVTGWLAEAEGMPLEWSFCATVVRKGAPHAIDDTTIDEDQRNNPLVTIEGMRCYAGAPLVTRNGHIIGAYCVSGPEAHHFSQEEIEGLRGMADEVMLELEHYRLPLPKEPAAPTTADAAS